jgi:hypothetical protein
MERVNSRVFDLLDLKVRIRWKRPSARACLVVAPLFQRVLGTTASLQELALAMQRGETVDTTPLGASVDELYDELAGLIAPYVLAIEAEVNGAWLAEELSPLAILKDRTNEDLLSLFALHFMAGARPATLGESTPEPEAP